MPWTATPQPNSTPYRSAQPAGQLRDGHGRLDAQVVRAVQRGAGVADHRPARSHGLGIEQRTVAPHFGGEKSFDHGRRLGPLRDEQQALLGDRDLRRPGDFAPDRCAAHCQFPGPAARLTGDGDKAEIADRRAIGLCIPVEHQHALAAPRGRQRMGEADDPAADDDQVMRRHGVSAAGPRAGN